MKLLVTAGSTREAIDPVRFLSNVSTGATGAELATLLLARGHDVTLLRGVGAVKPAAAGLEYRDFSSAADLGSKLKEMLASGEFDAVIMAAAVADYRPAAIAAGKIASKAETLVLELKRNPKLLPQLRDFSPRPLKVIGFKLTVGADLKRRTAAVKAQFAAGGVDAVVQNDLEEIRAAATHPFRLFAGGVTAPRELAGGPALAEALDELLTREAR